MMKKYCSGLVAMVLLLLFVLSAVGCQSKSEYAESELYQVYYKSADGTSLSSISVGSHMDYLGAIVADLLAQMQMQIPDNPDLVPAIPQSISILNTDVNKSSYVIVNFNEEYQKLSKTDELLCRAAITLTLTQIDTVDYVEIEVNGKKIKNSDGQEIGSMDPSVFITDSSKRLSLEKTSAIVYFPNSRNTKLVQKVVTDITKTESDSQKSEEIAPEKLILSFLQKGPESENLLPILSSDVKILNHSIKNGTCYVNFDESFLLNSTGVKPELVIYGIVNSLCELSEVSKVQFFVDGRSDVKFANEISLEEPFSRDGSYVLTTD